MQFYTVKLFASIFVSLFKISFIENPFYLHVTDINHVPEINNLPGATVTVPENTAVGTGIFTVAVTDADPGDTHTYTVTYSPAEGDAHFSVNTNSVFYFIKGDPRLILQKIE